MSAEHWFDRLSRPHSRRAVLKAAVAGGAALMLPASRLPSAWATPGEPCFTPCLQAAAAAWDRQNAICEHQSQFDSYVSMVVGPLGTISFFGRLDIFRCLSSAELKWHKDVLACGGSECGDPGKYPGGKVRPKCDPSQEKVCGSICCYITSECCNCKRGAVCCRAGQCHSCCGTGG